MLEPRRNGVGLDYLDEPARPRVCVLGRLRVIDAEGVERIPRGDSVRTLLLFLALSGAPVHVEQVIEVLWHDVPVGQGRQRLRNVLARLLAQCGPVATREGDTLVLRASTDIAFYDQALSFPLAHAGQEIAPDARYADWAVEVRRRMQLAAERLVELL